MSIMSIIRKIINFLHGYRKLKVMAIVGEYTIVANLKGQFVGVINYTFPNEIFFGRVSKRNTQKLAEVIPASYKYSTQIIPKFYYDIGNFWWGYSKNNKNELVIIRNLNSNKEKASVACNVRNYIYVPTIEIVE